MRQEENLSSQSLDTHQYQNNKLIDTLTAEQGEDVVINCIDKQLENTLFVDRGEKTAKKIQSGISYLINEYNGHGELIIGVRQDKPGEGRHTKVWPLVSAEDFNFVQPQQSNIIKEWERNFLLTLSVSPDYENKDTEWRKSFSLTPRIFEISDSGTLMKKWFINMWSLTTDEFKKYMNERSEFLYV